MTFSLCTGVCLIVTSIVYFNKAVDIWTLCDKCLERDTRDLFYCFIWHTAVPLPITVAM